MSWELSYVKLFGSLAVVALAMVGCSDGSGAGKNAPRFRFAPIERATIVRTVEATGTVTPRNTSSGIPVGAQVNGKVLRLFVDYNSVVTNGQIVALIDPLVYEATYKSAIAQLHVNQANVEVRRAAVRSSEAELTLAKKTHFRKMALTAKALAAVVELDKAVEALSKAEAGLASAQAYLKSAEAAVEQSEAAVSKARADLDYCTIRSPVNGVVIARRVEEGETVVSSYNAVPLLTIAEDLKVIWVAATVPEADVGNVRVGQLVSFTADAYRKRFTGRVKQVRRASTTTNNVVTYPVIIEAENPGEMLFPGMTATLSIETARAENALAVSAAAFRFRPKDEDLPGGDLPRGRKLWTVGADGKLACQVVTEGVSDGTLTELVGVDTLEGREAVVGYVTAATARLADETTNPFGPKFPQRNKNKGTAPEPKQ